MHKKALIVPYVFLSDNESRRLATVMFRDTETAEWTFVSGGCKEDEPCLDCARREFKEETYGAFCQDEKKPIGGVRDRAWHRFRFRTKYRPEKFRAKDRGARITSEYSVFLFEMSVEEYAHCAEEYHRQLSRRRELGETSGVTLFDMTAIEEEECSGQKEEERKGQGLTVWDFIAKECLVRVRDHIRLIASKIGGQDNLV